MKCPECVEANERSRVYSQGTFFYAMGVSRFWDEDGERHVHDPNHPTTSYKCSNGHYWSETKRNRCPTPEYDY